MNSDARLLRVSRVYVAADEVASLGLSLLPAGAVIFPKAGGAIATNKKRLLAVPGAVDLNCMAIVPGKNLDERFLWLWFEALNLPSIADGSILPQISKSRVLGLQMLLPPLDEQRRIVAIVEDHLSRLEAGASSAAAALGALAALRMATLQGWRERLLVSGATERSLSSVAGTALGKMLDAKRANGVPSPYLRNVNVRWGHVDVSDVATVPLSDAERRRFALVAGDLLVCEGGEPGRCAIWRGKDTEVMTYQKALHRVRPHDGIEVDYLALMLEAYIRSGRSDRLFTGTTINHLPQEKLRSVPVPVPGSPFQRKVVENLSEQQAEVTRLQRVVGMGQRRGAALRRSLLQAAFSGQLTASYRSSSSSAPDSAVV